MRLPPTRLFAILCAPALALSLSACAQTVSTSGLKGEAKAAAETIKDLQSNVTSGEQKIPSTPLSILVGEPAQLD